MRVVIVAEYYPRAHDPVLGVWAHHQAVAAARAGADVRVVVLHRPVPPRAALAARDPRAIAAPFRQPRRATLDGIAVTYVPFLAPPRPRSYGSWGAWAAPSLKAALRHLRPYDLLHAHYAAPGGDAVRRADPTTPAVVSVHGGDLLAVAHGSAAGARAVHAGLRHARVVLANSAGMARRAQRLGARRTEVVHLGSDLPEPAPAVPGRVVTVGHLIARKRHADVARALAGLPGAEWVVVGDGPERAALERLTAELGVTARFTGALPHAEALAEARRAAVFALPSVDEAFGVAYVEAMAGGVPAIGCRGEDGPDEIAASGGGIRLVPPRDPEALRAEIAALLAERAGAGAAARETVARAFTWDGCGRATVRAYEAALA